MEKSICIDGVNIGNNFPPFIIAELSGNHNGKIETAKKLIDSASENGATCIKLQTYTADTMTIDSKKEDFKISGGLWDGYTLYELYKWAHTPFEWHKELFDYARKRNIKCLSTPFDETAVDLLEDLNCPAYKVASFEMTDLPLIRYIASTNKPMIISTGMASFEEIEETVEVARENGNSELVVLHCVSGYPTPVSQINLRTMVDLAERLDVLTGLSDHTLGNQAAIASVALGACLIEKHFILNRSSGGPDADFSMEPQELFELCKDSKAAWQALGSTGYHQKKVEQSNLKFRRSLYIVEDINEGELFTKENLRRIRPGFGLSPKFYEEVLGKKAKVNVSKGTPLAREMF